jgi:hypothetical protein
MPLAIGMKSIAPEGAPAEAQLRFSRVEAQARQRLGSGVSHSRLPIPCSPFPTPGFSDLAALEVHEIAVFGGVRLTEADRAGAPKMEGIAVNE